MKITYKLFSLLLVFSLVLSVLCIPVVAESFMEQTLVSEHSPAIGEELITNGSFEEFQTGKTPKGWSPCNGQNDPAFSWEQSELSYITDKLAHDGKYSLYLDNGVVNGKGVPSAYASTGIRDFVIGGTYEVSLWVYSPTGQGQFFFYIENYLNSGENPSAFNSEVITPPKGKWTEYIWNFKINDNIDWILFYTFMRGDWLKENTLYFDNISMKLIEAPEQASLSTNELFYYTDLDEGWATVKVRDYYKDAMNEWTADFALLDGEEVLQEEKGLKFTSTLLEWIFNPKLMTDRDKAYTVGVNIKDKNSDIIFTQDQRVERRYDRPKNMTRDGKLLDNNGQIYLPVDAYEVVDHLDSSAFEHTKRMGVTSIERYFSQCLDPDIKAIVADLDNLYYNKGYMAIVGLYSGPNCAASPENIEGSKKMVEALKDHPGVFAFNIGDEIVAKNTPAELLEASYRLVRDIDTVHPVYCVDFTVPYVQVMSKYADIIGMDDYNYFSSANTDRSYNKWMEINTFRNRSGKAGLQVTQNFRLYDVPPQNQYPTGTEIRNQFYQCLFAGVSAFGYYTFNPYYLQLPNEDGTVSPFYLHEQGDAIASWMANERDDAVEYFLKGTYPHFASGLTNEINYRAYVKGRDIYYIIINRSSFNPANIELSVESDNNRVKVNSFKAETVTGTENAPDIRKARVGILSTKIEPSEAAIFKVTPTRAIDTALLSMPEEAVFEDIADYTWASEQIEELFKKDIINTKGEGIFMPGEAVTRGDFAMFLVRALGLTSDVTENFDDVPANAEYAKELACGKALGILQGVGDNKFNPEGTITRQDLMTICARGLKYAQKLADEDLTVLDKFSDKDNVAEYALSSVASMVKSGIVIGDDNNLLSPYGTATRAETAVIIYRILNIN